MINGVRDKKGEMARDEKTQSNGIMETGHFKDCSQECILEGFDGYSPREYVECVTIEMTSEYLLIQLPFQP